MIDVPNKMLQPLLEEKRHEADILLQLLNSALANDEFKKAEVLAARLSPLQPVFCTERQDLYTYLMKQLDECI